MSMIPALFMLKITCKEEILRGEKTMNARHRSKTKILGLIFMLPITVFLIYSVAVPFIWNIVLSFQEWDGMGEAKFVGIANYIETMKDPLVLKSMLNSVILAVGATIGAAVIGLLLATLLYRITDRSAPAFRLILFSPSMLPIAVVGLMFTFMYNPEMGLINSFLRAVGLDSLTHVWLQEKGTAMVCIIIAAIWKASGTVMLLCFAAMQTIPASLYESCKLDGGGYFKQMTQLVYPLIKPMILLSVMNTLGAMFKTYDIVYVMTQGGPGTLTYTTPIHMTKTAFSFGEFGFSAAMGVEFTVVVFFFILIARLLLRGESYEF